ncbi:MAG: nidogen-like domain-containing protein [Candidatus Solibacter sp.]
MFQSGLGNSKRILAVVLAGTLWAPLCLAGAIVGGFSSTSDGHNDDGTYTLGGCDNSAPGGTCAGTAVMLGFGVNFFGTTRDSLFINTNGNVTFDSPLSTFTPFGLDDALRPIIAPYFADVDTRNPLSGVVTFGNGFFGGRTAFGVNWIDVGYFDSNVDKTNQFQLLLVDRSDTGAGNFDIIFNYDLVQWESGDGSFGFEGLGGMSARAGFSNGTGFSGESLELAGSGVPGSFIDGGTNALISNRLNSDVDGRYIFNARNGTIGVVPEVPEPGTISLFLAGLGCVVWRRSRR